jgi:Laminin EGF domain
MNSGTDASIIVKVMSTSTDPSVWGSFTWKMSGDTFYQPETTITSSSTEITSRPLIYTDPVGGKTNTGVYVWWDAGLSGTTFTLGEMAAGDTYTFSVLDINNPGWNEGNGNSAHQLVECSGKGTCDRAAGSCTCHAGYTGQACERCMFYFFSLLSLYSIRVHNIFTIIF